MEPIKLGKSEQGSEISLELHKLIATRLLVQANSGGGKSQTIRRILEQSHGRVQQIVVDIEGEFSSLRQRYDYVIAGRGGDAPADTRSAKLLARKLLELEASAICDISDLKKHERFGFVRIFLESLIGSTKKLWHPVLIVIDEAHQFCPQVGQAEPRDAVIDLCTRGRKRGFCAVLSTQRLSKLHKDACAELLNKMIGRTSLDIDQRRAGDELGLDKGSYQKLRNLSPGDFNIYGPALLSDNGLSGDVIRLHVGPIFTKHPEIGTGSIESAPTPSNKVKEILGQLQDLPEAAVKEAQEMEDLQREISDLKRRLKLAEKERPEPKPCGHEPIIQKLKDEISFHKKTVQDIELERKAIRSILKNISSALADAEGVIGNIEELVINDISNHSEGVLNNDKPECKVVNVKVVDKPLQPLSPGDPLISITIPMQKILNAMAALEGFRLPNISREILGARSGYSPNSGGFKNNLGKLRSMGLIDYPSKGNVAFTESGRDQSVNDNPITCLADLHNSWLNIIKSKSRKQIVAELINAYPDALSRSDLANRLVKSPDSGGYKNNLGKLRTLGAIEYPQSGYVRASSLLFPEGL